MAKKYRLHDLYSHIISEVFLVFDWPSKDKEIASRLIIVFMRNSKEDLAALEEDTVAK